MEYTLTGSRTVPAPPDVVFDMITDVEHLPDWNLEIPRVIEAPDALEPGAEWVVAIHAMKTSWESRSHVLEIDRNAGRFRYRSQTDDGNPSFAEWRWQVSPAGSDGHAQVDVEVDIRPRTFFRRWVLSGMRRGSLHKAIERSLDSLRAHVTVA